MECSALVDENAYPHIPLISAHADLLDCGVDYANFALAQRVACVDFFLIIFVDIWRVEHCR